MKYLSLFLLFFLMINVHSLPKLNQAQTDSDENNSNYTVDPNNVNVNSNPVSNTGENTSSGSQRSQSNLPTNFNPIRLNKLESNNPYHTIPQNSAENNTPSRFIREREKQRKVEIWRKDHLVKNSKFKDLSNNPSGKKPNANGYQRDEHGHYPNPFGDVKYIPEGGRDFYMQKELSRRNSNDESSRTNPLIRQPPPNPNSESQSNNNQETTHPVAERNLTDSVITPGDKSTYGTHPRNDFPETEPQEEEKPQPFRPPHITPPHIPINRGNSPPPPAQREKPKKDHGLNYLSARRDEREDRKYTPLPSDDPRRPTSSDNNNNSSASAPSLGRSPVQRNNPITPQERRERSQRQKKRYENNLKYYSNNNNNFKDLSYESQQKNNKNKLLYKSPSNLSSSYKTGSDQSRVNDGITIN